MNPEEPAEFAPLSEIADRFGLCEENVVKAFDYMELFGADGTPSKIALDLGFAHGVLKIDGHYLWHAQKIAQALMDMGAIPLPPVRLFVMQQMRKFEVCVHGASEAEQSGYIPACHRHTSQASDILFGIPHNTPKEQRQEILTEMAIHLECLGFADDLQKSLLRFLGAHDIVFANARARLMDEATSVAKTPSAPRVRL